LVRPWFLVLVVTLIAMTSSVAAQTLTVRAVGEAMHVRASGLGFISGPVLDRLQDGRSVRVDFDLIVLEKPNGAVVTRGQQSFNLSFDLWEQRFAVTRIGPMPRSISHLTARAAEDWCLDNVTVPVASLGRTGRDTPFWVRVEYRIPERSSNAPNEDSTFTLQTLIDVLSRRREDQDKAKSIEAGPFRLTP
jgi:hypothetical protein